VPARSTAEHLSAPRWRPTVGSLTGVAMVVGLGCSAGGAVAKSVQADGLGDLLAGTARVAFLALVLSLIAQFGWPRIQATRWARAGSVQGRTPRALVLSHHATRVAFAEISSDDVRIDQLGGRGRVSDDRATFEIGSVSKTFTGLLLADLVIRGRAQLDDPIGRWLSVRDRVAEITLLELATHTSGLGRVPRSLRFMWRLVTRHPDPYASLTQDEWVRLAHTSMLAHRPPKPSYSNIGFEVLSAALCRIEDTDYATLLSERVCAPLGMTDTYLTDHAPAGVTELSGHDVFGLRVPAWHGATGAGGIRSTATDLATYLRAHLHPAGPLGEAVELATTLHGGSGVDGVGLGWGVAETPTALLRWHNGGTGGFGAFVAFDRDAATAVALLTDTAHSDPVDRTGFAMLRALSA
jgi:D-alanyl-D-alanine-carboxypeptidase/D-alanyl-D-alanine-endopeptidase